MRIEPFKEGLWKIKNPSIGGDKALKLIGELIYQLDESQINELIEKLKAHSGFE